MRVVSRKNKRGAVTLWILGLVAAFFLVQIFCDTSGPKGSEPPLHCDQGEPYVGPSDDYYQQSKGMEPPIQSQRRQPSKYAVRGAYDNYRQSYQQVTQSMQQGNQQNQRKAYETYGAAYGGYRKYRW